MSSNIRKATISDIDSIYAIESKLFVEQDIYSKSMIEDNTTNENYINLVIENNKQILGYVVASKVLDEAEILKIAVDESSQKMGLGRALIEYLEDMLLDDTSSIFLEVRADNTKAIAFYERCGFKRIGIRQKYYIDTDAYIYRKGL